MSFFLISVPARAGHYLVISQFLFQFFFQLRWNKYILEISPILRGSCGDPASGFLMSIFCLDSLSGNSFIRSARSFSWNLFCWCFEPLSKIWTSIGITIPNIYGNINNVSNQRTSIFGDLIVARKKTADSIVQLDCHNQHKLHIKKKLKVQPPRRSNKRWNLYISWPTYHSLVRCISYLWQHGHGFNVGDSPTSTKSFLACTHAPSG